jgi:hypothetical protein
MADITAARLNNLQSRIALILGTGSGTSGYGQTVVSSQVNNTSDVIDADDLNNIYTDMVKARIHQVGLTETGIAQVIEDLNIIAEETSNQINDLGNAANDADGTKKGIADYESLMTQIEADKLLLHVSQSSLEPKITSTRSSTWNGLIYHQFTATFTSEDERRHFFNSGGEIRLSSNNTGAATPKGLDWAALCSEIGTIKFASTITSATGTGQGYAIGNNTLTSSYQTCFLKTGSGSYSGVYAGNLYTVKARIANPQVIDFRVEFNDVVTDNNVDNNVDGALTSTVQQLRAVGASSITSVSPSYFTSTQLSGFSVPQDTTTPTYALSASASSMNEGGNATLFLTTTNVGDTTAVPYTITGISINDLVNGSLTGSFIVQNNSASLTLNLNADSLTEGAEALTLSLNNGAATISVTINDNSTGTVSYYHDPHWYNEFSASFLANIPKSEAVNVADQFREYFYEGTGAFTNTLGQVRYALNRRPDAAGMAYWVGQWYNTYSSDAVASVPNDPNWTAFTKVFFTSVDASTSPIPFTVDGVALTGSANSDAARSLLATKNSIQGDGVGYYGDRGSLTGNQQQPSPPSATFAFTVTPATGMNFNVAEEQGVVNFSYTITCTAGSGSVTVQELTRPSNIPVRVDDSYSPGYPNQTTSAVATKSTGTMVAGSTRQLQLGIYPGAKGTWSGSFVFLESTGVGQNIQRGWGGTFT